MVAGAECSGRGVTVSDPMAVGPSYRVFVCRAWRDAHGAPHQPQTNESDHPVLLFVALGSDHDLWRGVLNRSGFSGGAP